MPRKLDLSKVADITSEISADTSDVRAVVGDLISHKSKKKPLQKHEDSPDNMHASMHALSPTSTLSSSSTSTLPHTPALTVEPRSQEVTAPAKTLLQERTDKRTSNLTIKDMAKWHTEAEQKVYKVMVMEANRQECQELYFNFQDLSARTGFKNRRTIISAIQGLISKQSIDIVTERLGDHFGRCYRIYSPDEVLARRQEAGIKIHPQTKRFI